MNCVETFVSVSNWKFHILCLHISWYGWHCSVLWFDVTLLIWTEDRSLQIFTRSVLIVLSFILIHLHCTDISLAISFHHFDNLCFSLARDWLIFMFFLHSFLVNLLIKAQNWSCLLVQSLGRSPWLSFWLVLCFCRVAKLKSFPRAH